MHVRNFSDLNRHTMHMKTLCLSLPAAPNLLASKHSLGDLYLGLLSSLELVNFLSLFLLFMLQQKPQARSAFLQAAENYFSVKLFVTEYNKTDRRVEGKN